ncbi:MULTISPECIES: hypothetical protein [Bradyrhizobium]|uniref:hypothetical protein n=1 Tax=Bradyrhizobium TaxID=374 RepID=UPI0004172A06|nr:MULTISPECIES: hypothetical protein [Bradyrhizobium]MBR0882093.1 hypothetical protein [Bradyrhizobium liaoningense]MBR1070627.1 hypothetical protein [Bradyrhizobium liaoningense]MCP1779431.1 hypothetical protein [Bradyrhizobium japonicum]WLC02214.1 hypothetical protein QIH92_24095 [Bradyrhizobium japonicum USDA 123]
MKRDIAAGALMVRQVNRYAVQFVVMRPEFIQHYVPDYQPSPKDRIVGHAKVELIRWIDRDLDWLGQKAGDDRGRAELAAAVDPGAGVKYG